MPIDRASDLSLLGLERESGREGVWSFELVRQLSRPLDGRLFGGTALAVAIVLGEVETDRPALWTTAQFVSSATSIGDRIECRVEVLAAGRSAAQVRVRGFAHDAEVFCAIGATGHRKDGWASGGFPVRPQVLPPEECPPHRFPGLDRLREMGITDPSTFERIQEIRVAEPTDAHVGVHGELLLWTRARERALTPAVLGYLADVVPMSVAKGLGRAGGGTSLDNTIRFGDVPEGEEWVLCQVQPHLAVAGYGHGDALLWTRDGHLLGTASQSASLILFD